MELQDKVNLMHFKRRASFDQAGAEDCTRLKRYNGGFNKAVSGPSLVELPLAAVGNVSQPAHSPIVECTAMMHSEMEGQKKIDQNESWEVAQDCEDGGGWEGKAKVSVDSLKEGNEGGGKRERKKEDSPKKIGIL